MTKTEEFLKIHNINYMYDYTGRLIINNSVLEFLHLNQFDLNLFQDCTIMGNLWLDSLLEVNKDFLSGCIIEDTLDLHLLKKFPEGFLSNTIIKMDLNLLHLEYLPKNFSPKVGKAIYLPNLKSKTLSDLLINPGVKRELGFNLLN